MNAEIDLQRLVPAWQALQSAMPLAHIEKESDYSRVGAALSETAIKREFCGLIFAL